MMTLHNINRRKQTKFKPLTWQWLQWRVVNSNAHHASHSLSHCQLLVSSPWYSNDGFSSPISIVDKFCRHKYKQHTIVNCHTYFIPKFIVRWGIVTRNEVLNILTKNLLAGSLLVVNRLRQPLFPHCQPVAQHLLLENNACPALVFDSLYQIPMPITTIMDLC
jgi:hypothetical protein